MFEFQLFLQVDVGVSRVPKYFRTAKSLMESKILSEILDDVSIDRPPLPIIDGFDISVEVRKRADHKAAVAVVRLSDSPKLHTAVRLVEHDRDGFSLVAGFCVDVADVALPEDIAPQKEVNAVVETVLELLLDGNPQAIQKLLTQFQDDWAKTETRLEARWRTLETQGYWYDRMALVEMGPKHIYPGIAYRTTRFGKDDPWGNYKITKEISQLHRLRRVVPITHESLSRLKGFSNEERLQMLHPPGGPAYEAFWADFSRRRLPISVKPIGLANAVASSSPAKLGNYYDISFQNGDHGKIASYFLGKSPKSSGEYRFSAELHLVKAKTDIRISIGAEGEITVERPRVHEKRHSSVEILDDVLKKALRMIFALDLEFPPSMQDGDVSVFDSGHPVLSGLNVPKHHQYFVGLVLGAPYVKARRGAERLAALRSKKKVKVAAVQDEAKALADGVMLGKPTKRKQLYDGYGMMVGTRLGQVRTVSETARSRKRQIHPIYGFGKPRGLTPLQVAKLVPLTDPDALRFTHDAFLMGNDRDRIETAHRVSLTLAEGQRNPILDGPTEIKVIEKSDKRLGLRITKMAGDRTCQAVVIRVLLESDHPLDPRTGGAFSVTTVDGQKSFFVHPMLDTTNEASPEANRKAITFGIGLAFDDPGEAVECNAAFAEMWQGLKLPD